MIDLCKIFGVEEGEEFKFNLGEAYYKYIISCNKLVYYEENTKEWVKSCRSIIINDLPNLNIIKLPKKKEFIDDELAIFRCIDKKYKWVTRDRRYGLTVFENKPKKITNNREEYWNASGDWLYLGCFENMFQAITTEDEEPVFIDDYVERGVE